MKVVAFENRHLDEVTDLHMEAFNEHLNVLLGKKYIKAFLAWFLQTDGCVNVVGENEMGKAMGYIVGAPWGYQQGMNKALLKTAAIEMAKRPWIFVHKKILQSVWLRVKTILGLNKFIQTTGERYAGKIISLVGIGVSPDAMGSGIAKDMMDVFIAEATKKNYDYARLSVYVSNARARKFYEKCGWLPEHSQTAVMGYYKKLK